MDVVSVRILLRLWKHEPIKKTMYWFHVYVRVTSKNSDMLNNSLRRGMSGGRRLGGGGSPSSPIVLYMVIVVFPLILRIC
jgi:hypothetical protein